MARPPVMRDSWYVYAGDYAALEITLFSGDYPADLSAYSQWRASWRTSWDSADSVELDVDTSRIGSGVIVVGIPGEKSSVDTGVIRTGVWDLQAIDNGQTVRTFLYGRVLWIGDVTR